MMFEVDSDSDDTSILQACCEGNQIEIHDKDGCPLCQKPPHGKTTHLVAFDIF